MNWYIEPSDKSAKEKAGKWCIPQKNQDDLNEEEEERKNQQTNNLYKLSSLSVKYYYKLAEFY